MRPRSSWPRSRRSRPPISSACSASRPSGSTPRPKSTAPPSMASTSGCPTCCTRRCRPARCSAARSRATTSMRSRIVRACIRQSRCRMASRWSPTASGGPRRALEAMPIEWDLGANANVSSADLRARQHEALSADAALAHEQGDVDRRHGGCRDAGRGGVRAALSVALDHGADELHGTGAGRSSRRLGRHAEPGGLARGGRRSDRASIRRTSLCTTASSAAASGGARARTTCASR